tara:strand:- start:2794 stop:3369 length:576 start_codon:yes stop_codon:yes gene_type:complete
MARTQGAVDTGIQQTTKDELEVRAGSSTISKVDISGISNQQGIIRHRSSLFSNVTVKKNETTVIAGPYSIGVEDITYDVTIVSDGGNFFVIDGQRTPVLQFYEGSTYTFSNPSYAAHPIGFKNASTDAAYSGSGTGVTDTQSTNGRISITVQSGAPQLRYYCVTHGNAMGNLINVSTVSASLTVEGTMVLV